MTGEAVFLTGPSYVLGEVEEEHTAIGNLDELAERFKLAPNAGLWGWGSIRTSKRELEDMAVDTGSATLRAAGRTRPRWTRWCCAATGSPVRPRVTAGSPSRC